MPRGFSEQEKELIHQRLLEQGYRLFSAAGLRKTTVDELADAAGISKGAFYLFYESKEALCMDVMEEVVEKRLRRDLLSAIERPGASPRARLLAVLRQAFALFHSVPMLQLLTGSDYDLLLRRIPPAVFQQHVANDRAFFDELIGRCQDAGILITAQSDEILGVLYVLVLGAMHQDDWSSGAVGPALDVLLELVAAYFLGEITLQAAAPQGLVGQPEARFAE